MNEAEGRKERGRGTNGVGREDEYVDGGAPSQAGCGGFGALENSMAKATRTVGPVATRSSPFCFGNERT